MDTGIAFTIGPLAIRWYGILIALAFAVGSYLAYREALRQKLNPDELLNILLIIIPCAIVGARLYYVLMRWDYYSQYPQYILQTWQGGLAVHGGIIAAVAGMALYCRKRKGSFWRWVDILAPSLALGQAIGRWGNFFNQEAYGYVTDVPWAMYIDGAFRHPTFLYESIWSLLLFILLTRVLRRPHNTGRVFALYLIGYSVGRFFIESLRTDSLMIGPLRAAMLVSVLGVAIGLCIFYFTRGKKHQPPKQPSSQQQKKKPQQKPQQPLQQPQKKKPQQQQPQKQQAQKKKAPRKK